MFWVGLASLIMSLTGAGDDTRNFRDFAEKQKEAIAEVVKDPARRKQARQAVEKTESAFATQRLRLGRAAKCVELLDRSYEVKASDYAACATDVDTTWEDATNQLVDADRQLRDAMTDAEWQKVREKVLEK